MSEIVQPAAVICKSVTIDGVDVIGLTLNIDIHENIFTSVVVGSISIMDSDGAKFIEDNKIEFNEDFEFSFEGAGSDNTIIFKGVLNGLRSETTRDATKIYTIDFTTKELRSNEETFITKKFLDEKPEDVLTYTLQEKLGAQEIDVSGVTGMPMEFLGSRRKPFWIIKHVLTNGVVSPEVGDGQDEEKEQKELKNNTGFLCWQTLSESGENAYRACDLDKLLQGNFESHTDFRNQSMNTPKDIEQKMKNIVKYDFKTIGDIQSKMKSGAFKSKVVSFDMDTGLYKEFEHTAENDMTDKQKQIVTKPTRYLVKNFTNDKFGKSCEKHPPNTGDQSRNSLAQNNSRQNTFNDQSGIMVLYPQFKMHAGDLIDVKIQKYSTSDSSKMPNEKHSGKYLIKQISHQIEMNGKSYSQITVLRSTNMENQ